MIAALYDFPVMPARAVPSNEPASGHNNSNSHSQLAAIEDFLNDAWICCIQSIQTYESVWTCSNPATRLCAAVRLNATITTDRALCNLVVVMIF